LVVEPVYLKKHEVAKWRETICAVAFDELRLSGVYFLKSSVAVAFSEGRSNAIVVDSGHNFTTISRVVDGFPEKTVTLNFAGNIISHSLENTLNKKGVI
jgi:actin-related protein